jgi:hypothetical protein
MLFALVLFLIILWVLGLLPQGGINIPNITFFTLNNHPVTLWNLLTLIVISWIISIIPNPFRTIASILMLVWVVSILGLLPFTGIDSWLLLAIIVGLVFYVIRGFFPHRHVDVIDD